MTSVVQKIINYCTGHETKTLEEVIQHDKEVRSHQTQKQIDKTVEDSFPASDPPSH